MYSAVYHGLAILFAFIAGFMIDITFERYIRIKEKMHLESTSLRAIGNLIARYPIDNLKKIEIIDTLTSYIENLIRDWSSQEPFKEQSISELYTRIESMEVKNRIQSIMFDDILEELRVLESARSDIAGLYEAKIVPTLWFAYFSIGTTFVLFTSFLTLSTKPNIMVEIFAVLLWFGVCLFLYKGKGRAYSISDLEPFEEPFPHFKYLLLFLAGILFVSLFFLIRGAPTVPAVVSTLLSTITATLFDFNYLTLGVHKISTEIYERVRDMLVEVKKELVV